MKDLFKRLKAICLIIVFVLGTVFSAGPVSVSADPGGSPASDLARPTPDGTIYNTIQHFLYHVAGRDPYSFYDTLPCTGELRECIGYLLDAYQSQGVDLIGRFGLHPSASYPYANVRHFCAQLDAQLSVGDTVSVPASGGAIGFLFQKYNNADAAFDAGAFDIAGTIGLLTSPSESYGHCWISLGRFDKTTSESDMQAFLEDYYKLGSGTLDGTIATGDANKIWKAYGDYGTWRVHAARWSENVHGGCIVDNARASDSLMDAPCYVLIPTSDSTPVIAQGNLQINLLSALPAITAGNPNYSLSGVTLGIYADAACTKQLASVATDANGAATVYHLAAQTCYVKLKTKAAGYSTPNPASAAVPSGGTGNLTISLTPSVISTKISIQPQSGSASLAGAAFTVRFYACKDVNGISDSTLKAAWTMTAAADGVSFGAGATVVKAPEGTDGFYKDASGNLVFPQGWIAVEQTAAASGQSLGGSWTVNGTTGSGTTPATGKATVSGSNVPVILFTASYQTLQSSVSDGKTGYLVVISPSGDIPDSMKPKYKITDSKRITGLSFGTTKSQFISGMGLSALMSCKVQDADGKEKDGGALMKTGDTVRVYDRDGKLYFEGTVLLYGDVNGDGYLRMSDLIKIRNHILGTNPLKGLYLEAADCNHDSYIRMSDLIKVRNQVLGTATIVQTP